MKTVTIKVRSVQKTRGEEEQIIELITEALEYQQDECHFLSYEESDLSGIEGAKTLLEIGDNFIHMSRIYHGKTEMHFEMKKRSSSEYHTPYGQLKLESMTRNLSIAYEPVLCIDIEYDLSLQSIFESTNFLHIEVIPHGV